MICVQKCQNRKPWHTQSRNCVGVNLSTKHFPAHKTHLFESQSSIFSFIAFLYMQSFSRTAYPRQCPGVVGCGRDKTQRFQLNEIVLSLKTWTPPEYRHLSFGTQYLLDPNSLLSCCLSEPSMHAPPTDAFFLRL